MRFAARRDPNHAEIRDGLRRVPGCSVYDSSWIGGGFPDLCALYRDRFRMLEVKPPKGKPNEKQQKFGAMFPGVYVVVTTLDEAMREMGIT
jgi:hypothetical protein